MNEIIIKFSKNEAIMAMAEEDTVFIGVVKPTVLGSKPAAYLERKSEGEYELHINDAVIDKENIKVIHDNY